MEILFPTKCPGCGQKGTSFLCDRCKAVSPSTTVLRTPSISHVQGLAPYRSPIGDVLRTAKISKNKRVFRKIGQWMGDRAVEELNDREFDAVVPVPSPWHRKLRRGFNPSAILANQVASALGRPMVQPLSISPGPRQATLAKSKRQKNLGKRLRSHRDVTGHILLVDDVATTGSTAEACARELLQAGAKTIVLFVPCVTHFKQKSLQTISALPME